MGILPNTFGFAFLDRLDFNIPFAALPLDEICKPHAFQLVGFVSFLCLCLQGCYAEGVCHKGKLVLLTTIICFFFIKKTTISAIALSSPPLYPH